LPKPKKTMDPWSDPQSKPYVSLRNIGKSFEGSPVLQSLNLTLYEGEFFSILGGSGCGKTTILRILAGLELPDHGHVHLDGADISNFTPHKRPVNMMFQSYALFPHMTVEQNIAFGLHQDNLKRAVIRERVEEALTLVRMTDYRKRKPHQLSGGQKQRVALARSIVKRPKLLLLDEPMGALDRHLREEMQFELVNIQEKIGVTTLMVTHDQEEAMTMSSRIGVMQNGQMLQVGTPTEVYEFPHTRYVADFMGSNNLFEGRIARQDATHAWIDSEESGCQLMVNHNLDAPIDTEVCVAIRPEKMLLNKHKPEGDVNYVYGVISEIAYLGDVSVYYVALKTGKVLMVSATNHVRLSEQPLTWEEEVYVSWRPDSGVVVLT
jgi:putrescine transport system ATP-binding protein